MSPKICDILGYEVDEILGKTPFDLMPEHESKRIAKKFNSIIKSKKPFKNLENINLHTDGMRSSSKPAVSPILIIKETLCQRCWASRLVMGWAQRRNLDK